LNVSPGLRNNIVEMQKEFPDYDQVLREIKKEQNPDRIAATQTIVDVCNRKTFGGPAKKLNF
jgi:hypothetical protein